MLDARGQARAARRDCAPPTRSRCRSPTKLRPRRLPVRGDVLPRPPRRPARGAARASPTAAIISSTCGTGSTIIRCRRRSPTRSRPVPRRSAALPRAHAVRPLSIPTCSSTNCARRASPRSTVETLESATAGSAPHDAAEGLCRGTPCRSRSMPMAATRWSGRSRRRRRARAAWSARDGKIDAPMAAHVLTAIA